MLASDFGRDHGLMHEVVVSGRVVGADEFFWSSLAHDRDLFSRVREAVDNELIHRLRITLEPSNSDVSSELPCEVVKDLSPKLTHKRDFILTKVLGTPEQLKEWSDGVAFTEAELIMRAVEMHGLYGITHLLPLLKWLRQPASNNVVPVWLRKCSILLPGTVVFDEGLGGRYQGVPQVSFFSSYDQPPQWDCSVHCREFGQKITHEDYFLAEV
jgi:hypothetical protein